MVERQSSTQQRLSDQPSPPQPAVSASTVPPRSNVMPLRIGSRIQLPTNTPDEPFKYGLIRWIGEVPQIQGPITGIELVSGVQCNLAR